jgi:NADH-quinone oxidoreductase subunit N
MDLATAYDSMWADLGSSVSLVVVTVLGLVAVLWDALRPTHRRRIAWTTAAALLALSMYELTQLSAEPATAFFGMLRVGGYAAFVRFIILLSAAFTVILTVTYLERIRRDLGEVYSLVLLATAGMIVLATGGNLVTVFVGLETMSICLYVMAGLFRTDEGGPESAIKYFVLGAFSTGFFLYGIALLYGATGTMDLQEIGAALAGTERPLMFWGGAALLLVGFFFKISAVPFHMWTPDVYQGTPTTITGFMATASKTAAFASFILVLYYALPEQRWIDGVVAIAVATMILGNFVALAQANVKRMLAYSSIAHAGYVLVGLAAGTADGFGGALYYLLVYALMNIGAFGVMSVLEWDGTGGRSQTLDSLAGVGYRRPVLGVTMGVFMFSLAGFPPFGGFIGKYAVFAPAVSAGLTWLVVIGVLTSVVSAYYYLRVLFVFWMRPAEESADRHAVGQAKFAVPVSTQLVLVACAVGLMILGIYPSLLGTTVSYFGSVGLAGVPMLP